MKIFVTGATGYIGGSVAERLVASGNQVVGLLRPTESAKAPLLRDRAIEPILGTLDDSETLTHAALAADAVIHAANADHAGSVVTLIAALERSGKTLINTTGSAIVADSAAGEYASSVALTEDSYFTRGVSGGLQKHLLPMSALPPKADIAGDSWMSALCQKRTSGPSTHLGFGSRLVQELPVESAEAFLTALAPSADKINLVKMLVYPCRSTAKSSIGSRCEGFTPEKRFRRLAGATCSPPEALSEPRRPIQHQKETMK